MAAESFQGIGITLQKPRGFHPALGGLLRRAKACCACRFYSRIKAMRIAVNRARTRLLDLVRRAGRGENIVLTLDDMVAVQLVPVPAKPTAQEKAAVLDAVRKSAEANKKKRCGPSAARSQDFLYDEYGLPK